MANKEFTGVSFETVRIFLYHIFYGRQLTAEADEAMYEAKKKFILPLRAEYENPSIFLESDTYIQYFILRDKIISNDAINYNANEVLKQAQIVVRFVGVEAENWAKRLHHVYTRQDVQANFMEDCNGIILPYIGDIIPKQVQFFGTVTSIGFDIILNVSYTEVLNFDFEPLDTVSLARGIIRN